MIWKALIPGKEADEAHRKLTEIKLALEKYSGGNDPSLLSGAPGIALFWFYLGKAVGDEKLYERGMELIGAACERVEQGFAYPSFAGGLAGLGWAIGHLSRQGFIEENVHEILDKLTEPLHQSMREYVRNGQYDYLHGGLGIALYFLERPDLQKATTFLQELSAGLRQIADSQIPESLRWRTTLDRESGLQGYNLSLSHGQASIIDILGRIAVGYGGEENKTVLYQAVQYLLSQEYPASVHLSARFPSWITDSPQEPKSSRLAWCYGDLGIGQTLLHTGQRTGAQEWQAKGLFLLKNSLKRTDPQEAGVVDAGLCHGAAGIAHIYNRLWQETGDDEFAAAARHWFAHTLDLAVHEDGPAGYKAFRMPQYGGWTAETGLLEGVAGIGLALISALYPIEPAWDRLLLLS